MTQKIYSQGSAPIIWISDLSGAGKTTIGRELIALLEESNFRPYLLDGDVLRGGLNSNLGFSLEDRNENLRRAAEVAKILSLAGVTPVCCFITPTNDARSLVNNLMVDFPFVDVFLSTPLSVCESRDVKGLYAKARAGIIKEFTGISSPFETPESPTLEISTDGVSVNYCASKIMDKLKEIFPDSF